MRPKLCVGIAGGTGSGKTTVARELVRRLGPELVAEVNQDRYYRDLSHLAESARVRHNFDHPEAIDEQELRSHLELLRSGRPAALPVYDFARHLRSASVEWLEPRPVLLVEGILVLALPSIQELLDVKIFVDTPSDLRFIRRLKRDMTERARTVDSVVEQYMATVRPMHLEFVEPSKRRADVIVPEGGFNTVALDLIISHLQRLVGRS